MPKPARTVWLGWLMVGISLLIGTWSSPVVASVTLEVAAEHVGLGGVMRPGDWAPVRVVLTSHFPEPRQVRCQWIVPDVDGDQVQWQRSITLTPGRSQPSWLYAAIPIHASENDVWRIDVLDEQTHQLLATHRITPAQWVDARDNLIGLTTAANLGLNAYDQQVTQHEPVRTIRSLSPVDLPDRWYGLASLSALIWTPSPRGDPMGAVSLETQQAVRQWVQRGGHLVIVLPGVAETWSRSPLRDLLPAADIQRMRIEPPWFLGAYSDPHARHLPSIEANILNPTDDDVAVLLWGGQDQQLPLVVAHQVGFGRVTLIGIDLTDPRLLAARVPNGGALWGAIFTWRSPAIDPAQLRQSVDERHYSDPVFRPDAIELGAFIPGLIAMSRTAAWALVTAVVFFAIYWVAAGPLPMAILRYRQRVHHSWLTFSLVVLSFAAVAWGGAWLLRPSEPAIEHFSILDIDRGAGLVRTQSWASVFVPRHDDVLLQLDAPDPAAGQAAGLHTFRSTGILPQGEDGVFIDTQRYVMPGAHPNVAAVPIRATPKQVQLSYLGSSSRLGDVLAEEWVTPDAAIRYEAGFPVGTMTHGLPRAMRNITLVYCPGNGQTPLVWRHPARQWQPGELLTLQRPEPGRISRLQVGFDPQAHKDNQSRLGTLMRLKPGHDIDPAHPFRTRLSQDRWIPLVELLSFFSALPPPDYEFDQRHEAVAYTRAAGRGLDLSHLLAMRQLIVIGLMQDAPLPAPLTVDGQTLPSRGWVVVRCIVPLPAPPPFPGPMSDD